MRFQSQSLTIKPTESIPNFTTRLCGLTLIACLLIGCNPSTEEASTETSPLPSAAEASTAALENEPTDTMVSSAETEQQVIVYSYRPEPVIRPLLDAFSAETGIETQLKIYPGDSLLAQYHQEPSNIEADLLVLVDAMRFQILADANHLRPLPQAALDHIPDGFKARDDLWLGLGVRARAALWKDPQYAPAEASDLISLAEQARVCVREGMHIYNRSFLSWLIATEGEDTAQEWATAIYPNREPIVGGDRAQIAAVLEGNCDVALVNHYYLAMLAQQDTGTELLDTLTFGWQDPNTPVQTNISGIAVTQQGANTAAADQLAIWLSRPENAQRYAASVFELPVNWQQQPEAVAPHVAAFSQLQPATVRPADFADQ
jgi:iron(III) transport system substrate-binding protein